MKILSPNMLRFVKSMRLQRGGAWRAARVGVVVMVVVVVWAWVYLVSSTNNILPSLTHDDWPSRSPNLQVDPQTRSRLRAPPPPGPNQSPAGRQENGRDENNNYIDTNINKEDGVMFIKPEDRLNKNKRGGQEKRKTNQRDESNPRYYRGREDKMEDGNYGEDKAIPKIFPQRRMILPGDTRLMVEEDEDEEEEEEQEEGKWNGRNIEEKDNHAMEEVDEVVGIDDDKVDNNNDDFVEEDVGGETMKKNKKREGRNKPEKGIKNNKKQRKRTINDLEDDNHHHHHDLEERSQKSKGTIDLPDLDLVAVEQEMRMRRARVKQVCGRHGLGPNASPGGQRVKYPPTPPYESFYIDRGDRLAWCPVYKAASTSWLYGFLSLAGISESYMRNTKEQVSTVARRVWPSLPYDEAKEAMDMCVKAFVVRHPFERLASAFRDKLERVEGGEKQGTEHFYQKYGKKIVEKYREKEIPKNQGHVKELGLDAQKDRHQPPPSPPQRYSNALDDQPVPPPPPPPPPRRYKHLLDDSPPQPPSHFNALDDPPPPPPPPPPLRYRHAIEESPPHGKEPTFPEFVRYLIDTDLTFYADDHWMPYHLSCTPCLLDFDVIAKFETLDRDQAYLLHKTHLQDKFKLSWRHLTKGNRTSDVVKKYFADVPKKHLLSLYGKYRLDFEMFDYSVADYLGYVKS